MRPAKFPPLIKVRVTVNNKIEVEAVYDTGSNVSLINYDLVNKLKISLIEDKRLFSTLGGKNFTEGRASLSIAIGEIESMADV